MLGMVLGNLSLSLVLSSLPRAASVPITIRLMIIILFLFLLALVCVVLLSHSLLHRILIL